MNMGAGDTLSLLPVLSPDDIVTPAHTLDFSKYGYTYDTLLVPVPEPASTLGILGLGAFGAGCVLKRKCKK
jgi:tyrosinase